MRQHKLFSFLVGLAVVFPTASYASFDPASQPLFLSQAVKHNLLFVVDDSGSMDWEIVPSLDEGPDDGYLFFNGYGSPYNGKAVYNNRNKIAADKRYQYLRSSDYNVAFYNPSEDYVPWIGYPDASVTAAKYDPNFNLTTNLTNNFSGSDLKKASYYEVTTGGDVIGPVYGEWYCEDDDLTYRNTWRGRGCYERSGWGWRYVEAATRDETITTVMQCDAPNPDVYAAFKNDVDKHTFTGDAEVLAPDGRCMKRVELANGSDEIQNFANWFTYYRRPHLAARGAIGQAVSGLTRMNLGMFYLNSKSLRGMYDSDTELDEFLAMNYGTAGADDVGRFGSGGGYKASGTPLRTALKKAGSIYDTNEDVIKYECQRNYTLLFTDGFTSSGDSVEGIGNADKNDGEPFADSKSGTMADISRFYYKKRLRGEDFLEGKVKQPDGCDGLEGASPLDCNKNLHMTTYTVGMGSKGAHFAGIGDYTTVKAAFEAPPNWNILSLGNDDNNEIDDLYHAAVNGHGEFYQADSTTELRTSIIGAIDKIKAQDGGAAAATFNTGALKEGAMVYAGGFNSGSWNGTLVARKVNPYTGESAEIVWSAEEKLDARDLSGDDDRVIITSAPKAAGNKNDPVTVYTGAPFTWENGISQVQKDALSAGDAALGAQRLAFIRGDRTNERDGPGSGIFRKRVSRLGDIVSSSPVYVGAPALSWPDSSTFGDGAYSQFRSDKRERTPLVFVGANDGMLHAFNAETGKEELAYVPSSIYGALKTLADPEYQHKYTVDLTPVVSDVYITSNFKKNQKSWRTVLVGGLGMGGGGLFALDVTDPATFTEDNAAKTVLWEFNDPRMGVITEPPVISMVEWSNGDYRWTALFGNGYGTDTTGMFMLDVGAGKDGWKEGTNFKFIELTKGVGGLSAVRLADVFDETGSHGVDRIGDTVYAGDLGGNLWVIDGLNGFNKTAPVSPLFKTPNNQPITSKPVLSRHTEDAENGRNVMVFFGTGKYLEVTDLNNVDTQAFYGVWDKGDLNLSKDDLVERDLDYDTDKIGILRNVLPKSDETLDWETDYGWYFDFDTPAYKGERSVLAPQIRKGYLFFDTTIPSGGGCSSGGQSFLMSLTLEGLDPSKPIFDSNNDGKINSEDKAAGGYLIDESGSAGSSFIGNVRNTRTNERKEVITEYDLGGSGSGEGRASWREVLN